MGKYHETLGVEPKATQDEIKKAFRKLAKQYHPDVNKTDEAKVKFQEITEAYEGLKLGRTGPNIDMDAREYARNHFGVDPMDIIREMHRQGTVFSQMHEERLDQTINVIQRIRIPVKKFLTGGDTTVDYNTQNFDRPGGFYYEHTSKTFTIKPGIKVGETIEFPGEGPKNRKGIRGNMIFQLFATDDGPYEVQNGIDIVANIQIDPFDVMLGTKKKILHPDGKRRVVIDIPPGGMPNQVYPQMGMGLEGIDYGPDGKPLGSVVGDMLIQAHPILPVMTKKQLAILKEAMEQIREQWRRWFSSREPAHWMKAMFFASRPSLGRRILPPVGP